MILTADSLRGLSADELHRQLLEARRERTLTKAEDCTLYNAWFKQACQEGNPPDKLDRTKPRFADIHRFWQLVDTETSPDGCWLWQGSWTRARYSAPIFSAGGRTYRAKRFAYEIDFGEVPPELMVVPLCGNYACVRPEHLEERPNPRYRAVKHRWSKQELIAAMQAFYVEHGRAPTVDDWEHAKDGHPGRATLVQHFGSITAARLAAGLPATQAQQRVVLSHCKRGHRFTAENTAHTRQGWRVCKECQSIRARASYQRTGKARRRS